MPGGPEVPLGRTGRNAPSARGQDEVPHLRGDRLPEETMASCVEMNAVDRAWRHDRSCVEKRAGGILGDGLAQAREPARLLEGSSEPPQFRVGAGSNHAE